MRENYLSGVIEGFYGKSWSWQDRASTIDFLQASELGSYIYAPKSDSYLRRDWAQAWPADTFQSLESLSGHCRQQGIQFGVGLSPFEAYIDYDSSTLAALRNKLEEIEQLQPAVLCLLFDDMRGDVPGLAALQTRLVEDIASISTATRVVMCPTYYSFDPILEKVFGQMPAAYWRELGAALDPSIDFFWTGDRVCSSSYEQGSLQQISEEMARAPVIWDNYPVNDSERLSRRLRLQGFSGRPQSLPKWVRGHVANPMNQAWLSRIPLCTLPGARAVPENFAAAARRICPAPLADLLERDLHLFAEQGLDAINNSQRDSLLVEYSVIEHPCAREVCAWLEGEYAFDPACLTD